VTETADSDPYESSCHTEDRMLSYTG